MKTNFLLLTLSLCLLLATGRSAEKSPLNLFPEGNMEMDSGTTGETLKTWSLLNGMAEFHLTGRQVYQGAQALEIVPASDGSISWILSKKIKVHPGMTYRITAVIRLEGPPGSNPWCGFKILEPDGCWKPEGGAYLIRASSGRAWIPREGKFTTGPETRELQIGILVKAAGESTIFVDDVKLIEAPEEASTLNE